MKIISRYWHDVLSAALMVILLTKITGCSSGIDFSALPLDDDQVINYGSDVRNSFVQPEVILYGKLAPGGVSERSSNALTQGLVDIQYELGNLLALSKNPSFDATQSDNYAAWLDSLKQDVQVNLSPLVQQSQNSPRGVKDLALTVEGYVKTGGKLATQLDEGKKLVPQAAHSAFDSGYKKLSDTFQRFYQAAVITAQSLIESDILSSLQKLEGALIKMEDNLKVGIIPNLAQQSQAKGGILKAKVKARAVRTYADGINQRSPVYGVLSKETNELAVAVSELERLYVKASSLKANAKVSAKGLYDIADSAAKSIDSKVVELANVENLKRPVGGDVKLETLVDQAFSSDLPVVLGDVTITQPTDLNRLMKVLATSDRVNLLEDPSSRLLIQALASAVVSGSAAQFGLGGIDNVVGPDHGVINRLAGDLDMSDEDYNAFILGRAQKIRSETTAKGQRKNIFAVFADRFRQGADVKGMVDEFLKDGGRVIVITKTPASYGAGNATFAAKGLSMPEGMLLANAIIRSEDKQLRVAPSRISEPLIKLFAALGPVGGMSLANMRPMVTGVMSRITSQDPDSAAIDDAVDGELSERSVDVRLARSSGVLSQPLAVVQANLRKDRRFYARGEMGGGGDFGLRARQQEEIHRLSSRLNMTDLRDRMESHVRDYKRELKSKVMDVVGPIITVGEYQREMESARNFAYYTLTSMKELTSYDKHPDICRFSSQNELPGAVKGAYDGGYKSFHDKNVAEAAYNFDKLKNPMQFFDIYDDGTVRLKEELSGDEQAAVSMNCFLTAPGSAKLNEEPNKKYDGEYVLKEKISEIEQEVQRVVDEAMDLSQKFYAPPGRLNELAAAVDELASRLAPNHWDDTTGSYMANDRYWKVGISLYDDAVTDGSANTQPELGQQFDIMSYLYGFPSNVDRTTEKGQILLPIAKKPDGASVPTPRSLLARPANSPSGSTKDWTDWYSSVRAWDFGTTAYKEYTLSYMTVYGYLANNAILKALVGVPPNPSPPAEHPTKEQYQTLNLRIWAWFLSRLAGPIDQLTDKAGNDVLYEPDWLYGSQPIPPSIPPSSPLVDVDPFNEDTVFIDRIFKRTKELIRHTSRYLVAAYAEQILEEYREMLARLYSLDGDDFEAFMSQDPTASRYVAFFRAMEKVLADRANIDMIMSATDHSGLNSWEDAFIPPAEIVDVLPFGGDPSALFKSGDAAPTADGDDKLVPIWSSLKSSAQRIVELMLKMKNAQDKIFNP